MHKRVGRMISILYRKNQVYLNTALKPLGLTASEVSVIIHLYKNEGASQEDVTTYLQIDKGATARVVQALIKKGFLRKESDPDDRRLNRLYPTESATALKPDIEILMRSWSDFLTGGLDSQAVDITYNTLEEMVKKVENAEFDDIRRKI